jgi:predicted transcriptional regulator
MSPQFVKMGLSSTGFAGKPESALRAANKRKARRRINEGYPWQGAFKTPEELDRYLSGDIIECLLCGKVYKTLGVHILRIHGVSVEKYQERFGIPYSRKLDSATIKDQRRVEMARRIELEILKPGTKEQAAYARRQMGRTGRLRMPVRDVLTQRNLSKINSPENKRPCIWNSHRAKFGSEEHLAKLRKKRGKQTLEHITKRKTAMMETKRKKKANLC